MQGASRRNNFTREAGMHYSDPASTADIDHRFDFPFPDGHLGSRRAPRGRCTTRLSTWRSWVPAEMTCATEALASRGPWGLLSLIGLGNDLPIRPGLVLNKPPFGVCVIRPLASHHIDADRPFVRSGQRPDDTLTDNSPDLTLARFCGQQQ